MIAKTHTNLAAQSGSSGVEHLLWLQKRVDSHNDDFIIALLLTSNVSVLQTGCYLDFYLQNSTLPTLI